MFQKLKIVIISAVVLTAGIAAAQGKRGGMDKQARKGAMLEKFDTNKDGKLDPAEKKLMFDERAAKQFAKLDKNKDGVLSLDEFKAQKGKQGRKGRGKFRGGRGM